MTPYCSVPDTPYLRPIALPDRSLVMSPLPPSLAQDEAMLNEAEQANGSWLSLKHPDILNPRRCWGLQMDLGKPKEEKPDLLPPLDRRAPASPPPSPSSATSRIPTALNSDGARVLHRRRSPSATSPPPSPTKRIKQRFGVGDDEDEDLLPLPSFTIPTPEPSFLPLFPLSPIQSATLEPSPLDSLPTLRRATSLSRLLTNPIPLRRRSTTAIFRPSITQIPELQLSRSSSDTKGKRAASGWKRELGVLGVLGEESTDGRWVGFEVAGSSRFDGTVSYGWSGGELPNRKLAITNPDGLVDDVGSIKDDEAQVAMELDDTPAVGLAL